MGVLAAAAVVLSAASEGRCGARPRRPCAISPGPSLLRVLRRAGARPGVGLLPLLRGACRLREREGWAQVAGFGALAVVALALS